MRISELAVRAGVPVSTVRYYERIGLLPTPERTDSGYRDYDEDSATRLAAQPDARYADVTRLVVRLAEPFAGRGAASGARRRLRTL